MKKVFVLLLGALVVSGTGSCGRNQKAAEKQAELAKIQAQQDSARRADQERLSQLQAQQDSIAMAQAMSEFGASVTSTTVYSSYYIVVGSFLSRDNASGYLETMQSLFDDAQIVRNGRWNLVCVGGTFGSFSAAARRLSGIKSQLGEGGGGDEEEESDEEESDEEEYEEDEGGGGYSGSGEAWICGI